jgi:hypothetical protein
VFASSIGCHAGAALVAFWVVSANRSSRSLDARLAGARVEPSAEPHEAWRRLREAEGHRTTIIDLYELVARRRGLAWHRLPQAELMS